MIASGLVENMNRDLDEGGATLRDEGRKQYGLSLIRQIEGTAMRVQNPDRALNNQAVKLARADALGKGFAQAVKKIKDPVFLDLKIRALPLQLADASREGIQHHQERDKGAEKQRQEDVCPHGATSETTLMVRSLYPYPKRSAHAA